MNGIRLVMIAGFLLSGIAVAQRGGGMAGGHGTGAPQQGRASPAFGSTRLSHESGSRGWNQSFPSSTYPAFWGQTAVEPWPSQSSPGTIILMVQPVAQAAPDPPPAPPAPARAQMREYSWRESSADSALTFAIVLADGTVKRAITTCRQHSVLTYVDAGGAAAEIEVSKIDRDATRRANSRDLLE